MITQESSRVLPVLARNLWTGVAMLPLLQRTFREPRRGTQQPPGLPDEDLRSRPPAHPARERSEPRRLAAPRCCEFPNWPGERRGPFGPPALAPSVASRPFPTLRHGYRTLGGPPRVDEAVPGGHHYTTWIPSPLPPPCLPARLRSVALQDSLPRHVRLLRGSVGSP